MSPAVVCVPLMALLVLSACSPTEKTGAPAANAEAPKATADAAPSPQAAAGPRAFVRLKSGSTVPGAIVASSKTDMVVAGDDGIEHKIPLTQVQSVEYAEAPAPARTAAPAPSQPAVPQPEETRSPRPQPVESAPAQAQPAAKTYVLARGTEVSVRTNELIDSKTAAEGQTYSAQVTRDAKDADGNVVIPRGASANIVIRSASQGGRIRGASDLVLDLQSVTINRQRYSIDTVDVTKKGKAGVGANRRTAEYTGGGAAIGAVIGAIAGGGKGAAIGAGAGAGAGALTQILTKGRSIKVPAESVLTFELDQSLKVTRRE